MCLYEYEITYTPCFAPMYSSYLVPRTCTYVHIIEYKYQVLVQSTFVPLFCTPFAMRDTPMYS